MKRSSSGIHSFELVAGLLFLIPMFLYTINYAVVLYAGAMNNNCCTAAARAAAEGPPTNYTNSSGSTPTTRAQAVLKKVSQTIGVIRESDTVYVAENILTPVPSYGAAGFGGPFIGNVTIQTTCNVYPPFSLPFTPQSVTLHTSQTFPWTWVMPQGYTPASTPSGANNAAFNNMP
jgi:Flp pilus assembly protein TadG